MRCFDLVRLFWKHTISSIEVLCRLEHWYPSFIFGKIYSTVLWDPWLRKNTVSIEKNLLIIISKSYPLRFFCYLEENQFPSWISWWNSKFRFLNCSTGTPFSSSDQNDCGNQIALFPAFFDAPASVVALHHYQRGIKVSPATPCRRYVLMRLFSPMLTRSTQ